MRFIVDECTGPTVAHWLRTEREHQVFSVYEEARGSSDEVILHKAYNENWVLITNDKDFGEKIYRERHPHWGVIFMRLKDERAANKIAVLRLLLDLYGDRLLNQFVVVTEKQVRFGSSNLP